MLSPIPEYTSCPECGTSVGVDAVADHVCDERQRDDQLARTAAGEAASFELEFGRFLASPQGRFEVFYAQRRRTS